MARSASAVYFTRLKLELVEVINALVASFNKWKDAVENFNAHESTDYNKSCAADADAFMSVVSYKQDSVVSSTAAR